MTKEEKGALDKAVDRLMSDIGGGKPKSIGVDLEPAPRKKSRGYARMQELQAAAAEADEKSHAERLAVRARMVGAKADKKGLAAMKHVMLSEPAGQAIWLHCKPDEANTLWGVYSELTAAEARYATVVLGTNIHAKVANVVPAPEVFEARSEEPADERTDDEKHRAAVNVWMRWKGNLWCLGTDHHRYLMDVLRGRKEPVVEGELTHAGRKFIDSLRLLKKIVDQK